MTDITELAQSLKAAATNVKETAHIARYLKATIARQTFKELMTPENILALVEALESEKRICATWRKTAKSAGEKLEKAQTINAAAEKLVRCKGRYHSEQNYRALAALFGVNTPDLPPLEHENVHYVDAAEMEIAALRQRIAELESRTVTVKLPESFKLAKSSSGLRYYYADEVDAAIIAAGIKVETE
ncbi:ead/Ea22-like family protein [Klebsiella pneumoniae]